MDMCEDNWYQYRSNTTDIGISMDVFENIGIGMIENLESVSVSV